MEALISAQPCFRALSDPTRRDILRLLSGEAMTIQEVAAHFDMTRAAVKKHLTILAEGDLITVEARGRTKINRINAKGFQPVFDWLGYFDQFWDDRLLALRDVIEKDLKDDRDD